MTATLSTARALSLAALPLGHATTWCPCHGYREHAHLDIAAAHVVACGNEHARILSTPDGLTLAEEAAALAQARAGGPGAAHR